MNQTFAIIIPIAPSKKEEMAEVANEQQQGLSAQQIGDNTDYQTFKQFRKGETVNVEVNNEKYLAQYDKSNQEVRSVKSSDIQVPKEIGNSNQQVLETIQKGSSKSEEVSIKIDLKGENPVLENNPESKNENLEGDQNRKQAIETPKAEQQRNGVLDREETIKAVETPKNQEVQTNRQVDTNLYSANPAQPTTETKKDISPNQIVSEAFKNDSSEVKEIQKEGQESGITKDGITSQAAVKGTEAASNGAIRQTTVEAAAEKTATDVRSGKQESYQVSAATNDELKIEKPASDKGQNKEASNQQEKMVNIQRNGDGTTVTTQAQREYRDLLEKEANPERGPKQVKDKSKDQGVEM